MGGIDRGFHSGCEPICTLLGSPDDVSNGSAAIWRYGNFEIHFVATAELRSTKPIRSLRVANEADRAFLIFNDYIDRLDVGPGRALSRWIAADSSFSEEETLSRLAMHGVPYQLLDGGALGTIARIARGADLSFSSLSDHGPTTEWTSIVVEEPSMRRPYCPLSSGTKP